MTDLTRARFGTGAATIPASGRVVGVDLGARRIGVAVSDSEQHLAVGVGRIDATRDRDGDRRRLAETVSDYEAVGVVVGLPLSLSGAAGPAAGRALEEIDALVALLGVSVETSDERLSTVVATTGLRAAGQRGRGQRLVVDQTAAAVLLQSWLDRRRNAAGSDGVRG
jgi:putative Holliday junction resolvase